MPDLSYTSSPSDTSGGIPRLEGDFPRFDSMEVADLHDHMAQRGEHSNGLCPVTSVGPCRLLGLQNIKKSLTRPRSFQDPLIHESALRLTFSYS